MTKLGLTDLERAVLSKLLSGDSSVALTLKAQLEVASVADREWHGGAGFVTTLEVPPSRPRVGEPADFEVSDVVAHIGGMERPIQFVVFVREGKLDTLEGTSYDEEWPDPVSDYSLQYTRNPRVNPILDRP